MADQSDHEDYSAVRNGSWAYYQFYYRQGEAVVVVTPEGEQHRFYIHSGGMLSPMNHQCRVEPGRMTTQGYFELGINNGSSLIRMQRHRDGICRGTKAHYAGKWTELSKTTLQMASQGLNVPAMPAPTPWSKQVPTMTVAPSWGDSMPVDPFGVHKHPSGLSDHDLEDCKACATSYGACVECYNTGRVPKANRSNDIMNTAEMIAVMQIQQGAKIISAVYTGTNGGPPSSEYHFKNVACLPLVKDDLIVVQTRQGFALATVTNPDVRANACGCPLGDLKHVVNKVDLARLNTVLEGENNAQHALALSEVTKRMQEFQKQLGDETFNSMAGLLAPPAITE